MLATMPCPGPVLCRIRAAPHMRFPSLSTPLIVKALMIWPIIVAGKPARFEEYCQLRRRDHGRGLLGGGVWAVGTLSNLVSGASIGLALSYAIGQAAPMVATAWGLLYFGEFDDAPVDARRDIALMFVLYAGAIGLIAHGGSG